MCFFKQIPMYAGQLKIKWQVYKHDFSSSVFCSIKKLTSVTRPGGSEFTVKKPDDFLNSSVYKLIDLYSIPIKKIPI